jgi:hypothetical protein
MARLQQGELRHHAAGVHVDGPSGPPGGPPSGPGGGPPGGPPSGPPSGPPGGPSGGGEVGREQALQLQRLHFRAAEDVCEGGVAADGAAAVQPLPPDVGPEKLEHPGTSFRAAGRRDALSLGAGAMWCGHGPQEAVHASGKNGH